MTDKYKALSINFPDGAVFVPGSTMNLTFKKGVTGVEVVIYGGMTGERYTNIPVEVSLADMVVDDIEVS